MAIFRKKDPFDVKGLEQFTPAQQERILNLVAARQERIQKKKMAPDIKKEVSKREKQLEAQERVTLPEALKKEKEPFRRAIAPARGLLSTRIETKPLSPFQRSILNRERTLRLIRNTNPMDRARVLAGTSRFKQQRDAIRSDIVKRSPKGGLKSIEDSPVQQAMARQREKINSATSKPKTIGEEASKIGGILPSRLKAPVRLL